MSIHLILIVPLRGEGWSAPPSGKCHLVSSAFRCWITGSSRPSPWLGAFLGHHASCRFLAVSRGDFDRLSMEAVSPRDSYNLAASESRRGPFAGSFKAAFWLASCSINRALHLLRPESVMSA